MHYPPAARYFFLRIRSAGKNERQKQVLLQTQPANNPIYSGPLDAASKVVKAEGFGGLYKGVTSPLAGQMFFRATLFFGYARAKEIVGGSRIHSPHTVAAPTSLDQNPSYRGFRNVSRPTTDRPP